MQLRPTSAVIDLDAIVHNLGVIRDRRPQDKICAVVKADAYGHGLAPVGRTLERSGTEWLAVSLIEEGIHLRESGVMSPILVLGAALESGYSHLIEHHLTPAIFTPHHLHQLAQAAHGRSTAYHLKIDTGMSRLGCQLDELDDFLSTAKKTPTLRCEAAMTHFANAEDDAHEANERQVRLFQQALSTIRTAGFDPMIVHSMNSAATETCDDPSVTMVRPGLSLYGVNPRDAHDTELLPALAWQTSVIHLKSIPADTPVSYGGHWVARRPSRIATLPVGYADGYPRSLGGRSCVLIRGQRAPVVGSVCMDLIMVDVTDVPGAALGDAVVLLGAQGTASIGAHELASLADTIPYEILTGVQARVPRSYCGSNATDAAA